MCLVTFWDFFQILVTNPEKFGDSIWSGWTLVSTQMKSIAWVSWCLVTYQTSELTRVTTRHWSARHRSPGWQDTDHFNKQGHPLSKKFLIFKHVTCISGEFSWFLENFWDNWWNCLKNLESWWNFLNVVGGEHWDELCNQEEWQKMHHTSQISWKCIDELLIYSELDKKITGSE